MPDLKEIELSVLYDMLADYTSKYTLMMRWGALTDGFYECRDAIQQLQNEIDSRKSNTEAEIQEDKDLDNGLELVPVPA